MELLDKKQIDVVLIIFYRFDEDGVFWIFLQKRTAHLWEFPGGKVEWGESFEEALVREVHEEIQIDLDKNQIENLGVFAHEYSDKIIRLNCFLSNSHDVDLKNTKGKWFHLTQVAGEKFPLIEGSKVIIQSLMRKFYV